MGDEADHLLWSSSDDWDFYLEAQPFPNGNTSWIQKNGKPIKRCQMSRQHIINAMRLLSRVTHNYKLADAWMRLFEAEFNRRIKKACKK